MGIILAAIDHNIHVHLSRAKHVNADAYACGYRKYSKRTQ